MVSEVSRAVCRRNSKDDEGSRTSFGGLSIKAMLSKGRGEKSGATSPVSAPVTPSALSSPRLKQLIYKHHIMEKVKMSKCFSTLRDMRGEDMIPSSSLKEVKLLGKGAFGSVYLCDYICHGATTKVAVKRMNADLLSSSKDAELFMKECRLLRKISHRNVVEFIGMGANIHEGAGANSPGRSITFLVQEYCGCGSLQKLMEKQMDKGSLKLKEYTVMDALEWLIDIASGLKYLHEASPSIIHRDLKLENVLMQFSNGRMHAKLGDFGLSALTTRKRQMLKTRRSTSVGNLSKLNTSDSSLKLEVEVPRSIIQRAGRMLQKTLSGKNIDPSPDVKEQRNLTGQSLHNRSTASPFEETEAAVHRGPDVGGGGGIERDAVSPFSEDEPIVPPSPAKFLRREASFKQAAIMTIERLAHVFNQRPPAIPMKFKLTAMTGSLMYMAPETFKGEEYNEKVDIFSMGVIAWELFSGYTVMCSVCHAGSEQELQEHARRTSQGARKSIPKVWPEEVRRVVDQLWHQDAEKRPTAAEAVKILEDLRPVVDEWHYMSQLSCISKFGGRTPKQGKSSPSK